MSHREALKWLQNQGIDVENLRVIRGESTASFFANTDLSNAQIASFYPGAMTHAGEISMKDLFGGKPDLVIISPNDPDAMIQYTLECKEAGIPYLYDPGQQVVRYQGDELRNGVSGAQSLFLNDYEFDLLLQKTGWSKQDVIDKVDYLVVTLGGDGADIYASDKKVHVPIVPAENILDPTGVGDAFRGGFLTGFGKGWDLGLCGKIGALAATYCLEQRGPSNHSYTLVEFVQRFRHYFDDGGVLDGLLTNHLEETHG